MNTIKHLLAVADPWRHEPPLDAADQAARRAALTAVPERHRTTTTGHGAVSKARRLVAAAVVFVALAAAGTLGWRAAETPAFASVRFEVRLAETTPGPGLREAPVGTQAVVVYLHDEVVVTNDHVVSSRVVDRAGDGGVDVEVQLSAEGAARLRQATGAHIGRPMAVLIDGLVLMAPTVRSAVGEVGLISGGYARQEAERLVRGIGPQ